MARIIEVRDLELPELAVYARLTETQLRNRLEPEKGVFIAETAKVIRDGVLQEITDHSQTAALLRELCGDDSDSLICRTRPPYEKLPEELRKTLWWL